MSLMKQFADGMCDTFPECQHCKDLHTNVQRMCDSGVGADLALDEWLSHILSPLPSNVPYRKPLRRILDSMSQESPEGLPGSHVCPRLADPIMYHAYEYGDTGTILDSGHTIVSWINLKEKWEDPSFDEGSRDAAIHFMKAINAAVLKCYKRQPPYVPTIDELSREIEAHRQSRAHRRSGAVAQQVSGGGKLALAFTSNVAELVALDGGGSEEMDYDTPHLLEVWNKTMSTPRCDIGDTCLYDAAVDGNWDAFCAVAHQTSELEGIVKVNHLVGHHDEEIRNRARDLVEQINVLVRVNHNVPDKMRNRIEQAAETLAGSIMNGNKSLADLDLNQIGLDVLDDCEADDLSNLADNISVMIPSLVKMKGVPDSIRDNATAMLRMTGK